MTLNVYMAYATCSSTAYIAPRNTPSLMCACAARRRAKSASGTDPEGSLSLSHTTRLALSLSLSLSHTRPGMREREREDPPGRVTALYDTFMRNRAPRGPYSRPTPRVLRWSWGGCSFLSARYPCVRYLG